MLERYQVPVISPEILVDQIYNYCDRDMQTLDPKLAVLNDILRREKEKIELLSLERNVTRRPLSKMNTIGDLIWTIQIDINDKIQSNPLTYKPADEYINIRYEELVGSLYSENSSLEQSLVAACSSL